MGKGVDGDAAPLAKVVQSLRDWCRLANARLTGCISLSDLFSMFGSSHVVTVPFSAQSASISLSHGERGRSSVRSCVSVIAAAAPSAVFARDADGNDASVLSDHMASVANGTCLVLLVALVVVPLFVCAAKRQKYLRIFWLTWAGMPAWSVLCCPIIPLTLHRTTGDKTLWKYFPEPAGVVGIAAVGWLSAAMLTVIVKSIFEFVYSRRDKAAATKPSEP